MDILIFIIALSVLVLVHEFGHFIAARLNGVRVDEFGLGLPPRIVGKKKWGTLWSLNWLPIGGFCKMYGEDPSEKGAGGAKDSFLTKKPTQKAIIVAGGVLMNLILAVVVFAVSYTISGIPVESGKVKILEVAQGSPAEKAGLKNDEIILKIGDKDLSKGEELTQEVGKNKGKEVELLINREGQDTVLSVQIRENAPEGQGLMGVVVSSMEVQKIKWYQFYKGIGEGFKEAFFWGKTIAQGVWSMISGLFVGQIPKDVTGPIGMFKATEQIRMQEGLLAVIHFFGIISVNLAIVNILPFPALDGGRILFVFYELLTGKRANERFEAVVNNIGMMILLSLILLITIGDVKNLILN